MSDEQRTQMLARPEWLEVERQRVLENRATDRFESIKPVAAEDVVPGPALSEKRAIKQDAEEEATFVFDSSLFRKPELTRLNQPQALPLLDEQRARRLDFQRLKSISREEARGLELLSELLPPGVSMGEVEEAMGARLTELVGQEHRVKWAGVGAGSERDLWAIQAAGQLMWARVLPGQHRVFAGVQLPLLRDWVRAVQGVSLAVGDDFEFGLTTYLLAELFGAFTQRVKWPLLSWAVNPMRKEEMQALWQMEEAPLMELVFSVGFGGTRSTVHLWLPAGGLRQIQEAGQRVPALKMGADDGGWWKDLVMKRPLFAGRTELSAGALERLEVGDILLVEEHGVRAEEFEESVSEDGARWLVGSEHALRGAIFDDGSGHWSFEMVREGRDGEVRMSNQEAADGLEGVGFAVEEARVQVDVRIGMVELDLGSLARVRPGQVIDCKEPVGGAVDLVVSGAVVGRGELVAVDGRLGVRVLRMMTGADQR